VSSLPRRERLGAGRDHRHLQRAAQTQRRAELEARERLLVRAALRLVAAAPVELGEVPVRRHASGVQLERALVARDGLGAAPLDLEAGAQRRVQLEELRVRGIGAAQRLEVVLARARRLAAVEEQVREPDARRVVRGTELERRDQLGRARRQRLRRRAPPRQRREHVPQLRHVRLAIL